VREEERYPDIPGEAAIDGTGSHLLLEMCLDNNVPAIQYDQQIIGANHHDNPGGWLIDPARCGRVQMALDYVTRRVAELKAQFEGCQVTVESEQKSDPGGAFGRDDWWGTCDITITARDKMTAEVFFIEVADYKDGRGYVSEKCNSQNISYLFGKMRPHIASGPELVRPFDGSKIGAIRMTIIQPKTNPVIRYECSTRPEDGVAVINIIAAAERLSTAAHATDADDAPLNPGDHCQWCKANPKRGGHCTAKTDQSIQTVTDMNIISMSPELVTDDGTLLDLISKAVSDPKSLPVEVLSQLADAEEGFQAAFDKVKAEIQERIEQGDSVPGYAMVPGRGSNIWNEDEEVIVKKLKARRLKKDDIYPMKLISPAQVLKLEQLTDDQKKRIEKDLITFKGGTLQLKKVAHDHQSEKVVAQSGTDDVQSNAVELMFADVPKIQAEESAEVSFL
jgi:hypothetical protein